jgi:S1-C subfamily serine protease
MGMLILELEPAGAAETASLLPGDILADADDSQFASVIDLQTAIDHAPGTLLHLDFYRAGQKNLRRISLKLRLEPGSTRTSRFQAANL